jgi:hypothetical protein
MADGQWLLGDVRNQTRLHLKLAHSELTQEQRDMLVQQVIDIMESEIATQRASSNRPV